MELDRIIAFLILAGLAALAQPPGRGMGRGDRGLPPMGPGDFAVIRGEFGIANQVVQGAPYTADAITEFTRTLADGNRIQRTTTAFVARDSEGRTRTERTLAAIGPLTASPRSPLKTIFINDPVAGLSYVLDPNSRTARQTPVPFRSPARRGASGETRSPPFGLPSGGAAAKDGGAARKTEDLGVQTMQGLVVQGRRITRTIPAGAAGNQRAIDTVTEIWYSPDLQAILMSTTSDPRFGETRYQLTNIRRAEPDRSLFTVPQDYLLEERPPHPGGAGRAE